MIHYAIGEARRLAPIALRPFHEYLLDDGSVWARFYRLQAGYLLRFPGLADFEISGDGALVAASPDLGTDAATVEHLYLNQVVPLALSRQLRPAFHASVVTVPGGCVAFLGRNGMGKSTLAAAFSRAGAAVLADDSLVVAETPEAVLGTPSHASLSLWQDSVAALVGTDAPRMAPASSSDKACLVAGSSLAFSDAPSPLRAAYLLQRTEPARVTIEALTGADRHMAWVENSFLLDIEDRELLARHFEWTHRIAMRVPTFALDYTRDYGKLGDVRRALTRHASPHVD